MSKTFRKDITGHKFGYLTVLGFQPNDKHHSYWNVLCDCGKRTIVAISDLTSGHTKSCGCYRIETIRRISISHGMTGTGTHRSWMEIKYRCSNKKNKIYCGKGISVCSRWLESFENFYADMGDRPSDLHQIDRIDNNGNYEPDNCRWATPKENSQNTSQSKRWIIDGKEYKSCQEAADALEVSRATIQRWCKGSYIKGKWHKPKDGCSSYKYY